MSHLRLPLALAVLVASSAACLSPRERLAIRYYSADVEYATRSVQNSVTRPELRLRRVSSAEHLNDRFVWRTAAGEYGYNDLARWTEAPVQYLQRALYSELFERGTVARSESLSAPTLDVELLAFEEQLAPTRSVRVAIAVRLTDANGRALLDRTVRESAELTATGGLGVADGLRSVLRRAVADAARAVESALR